MNPDVCTNNINDSEKKEQRTNNDSYNNNEMYLQMKNQRKMNMITHNSQTHININIT